MPATGWSQDVLGEIEISMLAEAATTAVAITTLPPGMDLEPVTLELNHFRPTHPQSGNFLANARVVNANRFLTITQIEIEDPQGRQIAHGTSYCKMRRFEPPPPPPPADLRPVDEAAYATPDPYLRPVKAELAPPEFCAEHDGLAILRAYAEGRFEAPFARLTGCEIEEEAEGGHVIMTVPASEWFCQFSRSVAPGYIASLANVAARAFALAFLMRRGQSFVGLSQSVCFFRAVPGDGRIVRAEAVETHREGNLCMGEVRVYDADGAIAALGHSIAAVVDSSTRQKPQASEARRILSTLLFTDIVGSTEHAERLGDAGWRALLEQHHNVVRAEVTRCEGVEIDTAGDSFFVRFESPALALQCARAVRDAVRRLGVEVRVGVHTGECEVQGRKLTGMAVHLAARIQALAAPSEILVSSTVKDLAVGSRMRFEDRGQHTLRGVPGEWRLFSLRE